MATATAATAGTAAAAMTEALERLRQLETELVALRRLFTEKPEELPAAPFDLLEVCQLLLADPAAVAPPGRGIPQAPFLLGSLATGATLLHLLSPRRLVQEAVFDDRAA